MPRRASCRCGECPPCRNRARVARWQRDNPEKYAAKQRRYQRSPEGRKRKNARQAVWRAVRNGVIVRPNECARCGAPPPLDAHHVDYDKPLQVEWLCERCHDQVHNEEDHDAENHDQGATPRRRRAA